MKKIRHFIFISLALIVLIGIPFKAKAGGLSTQLGEVVIENLKIGQTYSLKELANLSLIVTNTSDYKVDLKIEVLIPEFSELRKNSEPIPDPSWIGVDKDFFELPPGEKAISNIIISIPDDEEYFGKRYHAMIWSHTVGGKGFVLAYGLKTGVIFTIDTTRQVDEDTTTFTKADLNFSLKPEETYLENIEAGKVYDVEKMKSLTLKITNSSGQKTTYQLKSLNVKNSCTTLTKGYEDTPDPSFLKFSEDEFTVSPHQTKEIKMYLTFPQKKEYSGRKYMFVIYASIPDQKVVAGVYSRLYASIK